MLVFRWRNTNKGIEKEERSEQCGGEVVGIGTQGNFPKRQFIDLAHWRFIHELGNLDGFKMARKTLNRHGAFWLCAFFLVRGSYSLQKNVCVRCHGRMAVAICALVPFHLSPRYKMISLLDTLAGWFCPHAVYVFKWCTPHVCLSLMPWLDDLSRHVFMFINSPWFSLRLFRVCGGLIPSFRSKQILTWPAGDSTAAPTTRSDLPHCCARWIQQAFEATPTRGSCGGGGGLAERQPWNNQHNPGYATVNLEGVLGGVLGMEVRVMNVGKYCEESSYRSS